MDGGGVWGEAVDAFEGVFLGIGDMQLPVYLDALCSILSALEDSGFEESDGSV